MHKPPLPLILIAPDEEFRPIVNWEGCYSVSNYGRVKRDKRGKAANVNHILRPRSLSQKAGLMPYLVVALKERPRRKQANIHQLVAAAFIGPCPAGMEVGHIDHNPQNNHVSNLEYATHYENDMHSLRADRKSYRGLTSDKVRAIRSDSRSQTVIAAEYGISQQMVSAIKLRQSWQWLDPQP